jgi:hypothetical protein
MTAPSHPGSPHPTCEQPHVIQNDMCGGRRRSPCHGCGRCFGETEGTPISRLHSSAAEEIAGHTDETCGEWLRRASEHVEA